MVTPVKSTGTNHLRAALELAGRDRDADTKNRRGTVTRAPCPSAGSIPAMLDFNPNVPRSFRGRTLEARYGTVDAEVMPSYLRAYALVSGRRLATTAAVQVELFGG